jgi:hypothetical protein
MTLVGDRGKTIQYFDDQWLSISADVVLVKASGLTFRTDAITGVRVFRRSQWWWLAYVSMLLFIVAGYSMSCGVMCIAALSNSVSDVATIAGWLVVSAIVLLFCSRRTAPFQHHVMVSIEGREHGLIYSASEAWAQSVVQALRAAMTKRVA